MKRIHTRSRWRLWAALALFVAINLVYWQDPWFWRNYTQFFLSGIFNGRSLGAAFADARNAIKGASGRVRQNGSG